MNKKLKNIPEFIELLRGDNRELRSIANNALKELAHPSVPQHLIKLISADISTRNLAGEILLHYGDISVPALKEFISSVSDADDLKFAIDLLGAIGNNSVEQEIINIFKCSTSENLTLSCIEAFGNLKCVRSIDFLLNLYGTNILFDPIIIDALGKIGSTKVKNFLLSKYQDSDDIIKFSIIQSFGEIGDEDIFFLLLSELNKISGPLNWELLKSIYNLKNKFGFDVPFDDMMKNHILDAVHNGEREQKSAALKMLLDFDDKNSIITVVSYYGIDPEFDALLNDKITNNSLLILKNLTSFTNCESVSLTGILNILVQTIKEYPSIKEIPELQQKHIISTLTDLLNHPGEEIRYYTQELLSEIDPSCLIICSDLLINDSNIWNRARYLDILAGLEMPKVSNIIKLMAKDPDMMIRERAEELLKMYGGAA